MSQLIVVTYSDGALVVDSRLIAEELAIEHESFMKTIKQYQNQTETAFGGLRFEIGVPQKATGNPPQFVYLTEDQATFLMTLSRNTPNVVQCKIKLVSQFSKAKKLLLSQGYYREPYTSVYIRRLENSRDHMIADDMWSVFKESSEILLEIEKDFRVPVDQMDLCDGSIGKRWSQYRKDKDWCKEPGSYIHVFRDRRGERECKAYHITELPCFRKWLREEYRVFHMPQYLVDKYGKRAVLQIYQEQNKVNNYILELTEETRISTKQEELYNVFLAAREALENRLLSE
jgi:phage regulator Rha-like protein